MVFIIYIVGHSIVRDGWQNRWREKGQSHRKGGKAMMLEKGDQFPHCQRNSGICLFSFKKVEIVKALQCAAFSQCENKTTGL